MTKAEAKKYIDSLPDGEKVVVWVPRIRRKQRIESNGRLVFVIPKGQKANVINMFHEIGSKIGTQQSEVIWDWVLANLRFAVDSSDFGTI